VRSLTSAEDDLGISLKTTVTAAFSQNTAVTNVLNWSLRDPSAQFFNAVTISKVSQSRFSSNTKYFENFTSKDTAVVSAAFEIITDLKRKKTETETLLTNTSNMLLKAENDLTEQKKLLRFANFELQRAQERIASSRPEDSENDNISIPIPLFRVLLRSFYYLFFMLFGAYLIKFDPDNSLMVMFWHTTAIICVFFVTTIVLIFGDKILYSWTTKNQSDSYERELWALIPICLFSLIFLWVKYLSPAPVHQPTAGQANEKIPSIQQVDQQRNSGSREVFTFGPK
jgi:hypothetical protein